MIELAVNTESSEVRKAIDALAERASPERCAKIIARASRQFIRDHIAGLARSRHRPGRRHNFYADAARSAVGEVEPPDTAAIRIPHQGMALRYGGGTVRASGKTSAVTGKPVRMLSIPISGSEADGKTPGDFTGLFLVVSKDKQRAYLSRKQPKGGALERMFRLVPQTTHKPDPTVLPERGAVEADAIENLTEYLSPNESNNHQD